MVRLAGQRRAVLEQEVGSDRLQIGADGHAVVGADARLGIGVVADDQQPAGGEEGAAEAGQRHEHLGLDLGAVELGARRVGEAGAQLAAAGEEGGRLDRIVDPFVEAGDGDSLIAREIIFPARLRR